VRIGEGRPLWRSLLYVPTHVEKFVASAHTRGADAIILDLEDAVPPEQKDNARGLVGEAAARVGQAGADVLVRINSDPERAEADIEAVVGPNVRALYMPKVESADEVRRLAGRIATAEARAGLPRGHTRLVPLIESARGWLGMDAIAGAGPRVVALSMGSEDFCADVGMEPSEETLLGPKQQLIITAKANGLLALGVVGVATSFADHEGYLAMARRSRRFGFDGSSAVHPSQVALLNEAFSPTAEEVAQAQRIVQASTQALEAGKGAFAIEGKMIDAPIVARAQAVLDRAAAIAARG
jgi:citrate lyase subunit beta/citryl-CoA lyase